jgi:DNA end-binding protein Ku
MAARPIWKGYLRLSLVNCAVALYPATTETATVHFHKLNPKTGNRLRMHMVDEATGEEVASKEQVRGYEIDKGVSVVIEPEDLEKIALESTHILEITRFTPRAEIDPLYFDRAYFLAPDDKPSLEAFGVIRQAMERRKIAALSKVVMHDREHIVLLEPRGAGMVATVLHWPYEMRDEAEVFGDIPKQERTDEDLLDVADALVERKMGRFEPAAFKDRYEEALKALVEAKRTGKTLKAAKAAPPTKPNKIMEALRASLAQTADAAARRRPRPSGSRASTARKQPALRSKRKGAGSG